MRKDFGLITRSDFIEGGVCFILTSLSKLLGRCHFKTFFRLSLFIFVSTVTVTLTGCATHIEDPDPSSVDLKTLTLEKLTDSSTSYRSSGVSTVSKRYTITILTQHEKIDLDYVKMSGGKTSGVKGIMATSLKAGQTLRIECQSKVESGNLALIILSPDRKIIHQFPIGSTEQFQFTAQQSGIYFVRMGAESFSGEIQLERNIQ